MGPGSGEGPGFTVVAPPGGALPPADWDATVTQPAFPARPYQGPLAPAPRPQAPRQAPPSLGQPGPWQPGPGQPGQPQSGPPQSGPGQSGPPQSGPPQSGPPYPRAAPSYPPPSYPPPAYGQQPTDAPGFESFRRPYQPQAAPPDGPPQGPPEGPPRQPPRRHDGRRGGSSLTLWVILLVLLVGGGVAGLLIAHPFSHPAVRAAASAGTKPATPGGSPAGSASANGTAPAGPAAPGSGSASASPSAPAVTERQAAANVASMLSQSVSDRAAISGAATDVGTCGPNLSADPKVFDDAASSRKALLARLTALPGRAALPPALLSDLTQAWQASIAADQAYAEWANDMITQGCVANDTSDPGYQATVTPNANATKYKTAFTGEWNPVAAKYGLTRYQQGQL